MKERTTSLKLRLSRSENSNEVPTWFFSTFQIPVIAQPKLSNAQTFTQAVLGLLGKTKST